MLPFTVHPVGDCALLAGFTERIAPEIGAAVAALNSRVLAAKLPGVTETVPAFASLLVVYDPLVTDYDTLAAALQGLSDADGRGGWSRSPYATAAISAPTCPLWQSTRG